MPYNINKLNNSSELNRKENMNMSLKKIDKATKTGKLFTALIAGEKISEGEIRKRFGIKNPSATVSNIRHSGFAVYTRSRKAANGVQVTEYEMGRPSREIVALGYKAKAAGMTL